VDFAYFYIVQLLIFFFQLFRVEILWIEKSDVTSLLQEVLLHDIEEFSDIILQRGASKDDPLMRFHGS